MKIVSDCKCGIFETLEDFGKLEIYNDNLRFHLSSNITVELNLCPSCGAKIWVEDEGKIEKLEIDIKKDRGLSGVYYAYSTDVGLNRKKINEMIDVINSKLKDA